MSTKNKDDFIARLSSMTPEEINKFIQEKGKKPKLIKPFINVSKLNENSTYHHYI